MHTDPNAVDELMHDSFDMHIHSGPDADVPRRSDSIELAMAARERQMRGLVLKNKTSPTGAQAHATRRAVPEVVTLGSITLDRHVGGINPRAVEAEAKIGSKVVWMPTRHADNELRHKGSDKRGIRVIDEEGRLISEIFDVFDLALKFDLVVGTGHVSRDEVFALVKEGTRAGVKIVVTHPLTRSVGTLLPLQDQRELASMGAYIEHTFVSTMPNQDRVDPTEFVEAIRAVGAERCVLSSDFGQYHNPLPAEGFRLGIATLLHHGLAPGEVATMVRANPLELLGLNG